MTEPVRRTTLRVAEELDPRTNEQKALATWQANLIQDLGGEKAVTALQRELVEQAARIKLFLDRADEPCLPRGASDGGARDKKVAYRKMLIGILKLLGVSAAAVPAKKNAVPTLDELRRR